MRHGPSAPPACARWRRAAVRLRTPGAAGHRSGQPRTRQRTLVFASAHGRQLGPEPGGQPESAPLPATEPAGFDVAAALTRIEGWVQPLLPGLAPRSGPPGAVLLARVQQLAERARTTESQIDAVFALSPDGLVLFDAQGRVLRINPAFSRLTGLSADMLVGVEEAVFLFRLQARSDGTALSDGLAGLALRSAAAGRRDGDNAAPHGRETLTLRRPRVATVQVGLFDADASSGHRVLQLRDISAEAQIDQLKSEFLAAAAHELRTPMTSICGFVELLLMRELPPPRQRDLLERVHRQSGVMVGIVNDLLDLARIEAGRGLDFDFEDVDLIEAVARWVGDAGVPAGREPVRVTHDLGTAAVAAAATGGFSARVDRRRLQQALGNLLRNAYRYSPGGSAVGVHLARQVDAEGRGWLALSVTDHGIGLSAEALRHVGERFYRADRSGNTPGTGLGVSIVRQIVEWHGGRLTVDSVEGVGSCFTLLLPALA